MFIIGLVGAAGAGKSTAADALEDVGWTRLSFAGPLKRALEVLDPALDDEGTRVSQVRALEDHWGEDPWSLIKKNYPEGRRLMQVLGHEVGRQMFGADFWVTLAERAVREALKDNPCGIVFDDIRYQGELDLVLNAHRLFRADSIAVRIIRPAPGAPLNQEAAKHASENQPLKGCEWEIFNSGEVDELRKNILLVAARTLEGLENPYETIGIEHENNPKKL